MPQFDVDIPSGAEPGDTFPVEFEVYCETCGAGLCRQSTGVNTYRRGMPAVRVEACGDCLNAAREAAKAEGDAEGYDRGRERGDDEGYDRGFEEGFADAKPPPGAIVIDVLRPWHWLVRLWECWRYPLITLTRDEQPDAELKNAS